jgi:transposase
MATREDTLKDNGCFNHNHENVSASIFNGHPFFDRRDVVQVNYEMIRAASHDEGTITKIAGEYGYSRKSFYQISDAFQAGGLCALMPKKTGPKKPNKLNDEVAAFIDSYLAGAPNAKSKEISDAVKSEMGVSMHPRTVYRHLKKN